MQHHTPRLPRPKRPSVYSTGSETLNFAITHQIASSLGLAMKRTRFDIHLEEERSGEVRLGEREWELKVGEKGESERGEGGKGGRGGKEQGKQGKRRRGQEKMRIRGQEDKRTRGGEKEEESVPSEARG